jgi:hypothetical protein
MEARGALPPGLRALNDELARPRIGDAIVRAAPAAGAKDRAA